MPAACVKNRSFFPAPLPRLAAGNELKSHVTQEALIILYGTPLVPISFHSKAYYSANVCDAWPADRKEGSLHTVDLHITAT